MSFWNKTASRPVWSTPDTSKMCRAVRATSRIVNGYNTCTRSVCCVAPIVLLRENLLQFGAQHLQHMQAALVIADISGSTGLAIIEAILAGQRDPMQLAKLRDRRIKASEQTIAKSLEGSWRVEHLFVLG
jgi:hypothetical protein